MEILGLLKPRSAFLSGFLIGFLMYFFHPETLNDWCQLFIALAALLAAGEYSYSHRLDKLNFALRYLEFFNDRLLNISDIFTLHISSALSRGIKKIESIKHFDFDTLKNSHHEAVQEQIGLFKEAHNRDSVRTLLLLRKFITELEAFSVSVLETDVWNHQALKTTQEAFVSIVEETAAILLSFGSLKKQDDPVRQLYQKWEPGVERLTVEELQKEGKLWEGL